MPAWPQVRAHCTWPCISLEGDGRALVRLWPCAVAVGRTGPVAPAKQRALLQRGQPAPCHVQVWLTTQRLQLHAHRGEGQGRRQRRAGPAKAAAAEGSIGAGAATSKWK
jgi:hypothetical protein